MSTNRPFRILYVEDNTNDVELVRRALKQGGLNCDLKATSSRSEFVSALEDGGIDVILSDLGVAGFETLGALQIALRDYPSVPFFFVSGFLGDPGVIETLLMAGAADCVSKSELDKLVPAIRRALQNHGHPQST